MASNIIDVILRLHDGVTGGLTRMSTSLGRTQRTLNTVANDFTKAGKKLQKVGASITATGATLTKGITAPLLLIGGACAKVETDFEQSMANIKAFAQPTTDQFEDMKQKVEELATSTKFNLNQTSEAMMVLAKNGMGADGSMKSLEKIMQLAGGSGEDLAETADIVSKGINAFGMDASDTGHYTDLLTRAMQNSSASVTSVAEGFKYCALECASMGYSMTDTVKFLTMLEKSGKNGSVAGTTLRTTLAKLNSQTKPVNEALAELHDKTGININDATSLQGLMDNLRNSFGQLNDKEKEYYANKIAGQRGQSAILALTMQSDEEYKKLCDTMDELNNKESEGLATLELYNTSTDTTKGRIQILLSQLEMIAHLIGQKLLPYIDKWIGKTSDADKAGTGLNGMLEKMINFMQQNDGKDFDKLFDKIMKVVPALVALGPSLMIFGKITGLVGSLSLGIGGFFRILSKGTGIARGSVVAFSQFSALMGGNTIVRGGRALSIGASQAGLLERALTKVCHPLRTLGSVGRSSFNLLKTASLGTVNAIKGVPSLFVSMGSKIGHSFLSLGRLGKNAGIAIFNGFKSAPTKILNCFKHPFSSIGKLMKGTMKIGTKALTGLFHPLQSATKFVGKLSTVFGRGAKAIFKMMSPATKIKLVMLALAVVGTLVYKNWDKIRPVIVKLVKHFKQLMNAFVHSEACQSVITAFQSLKESAGVLIESLKPIITLIIQKVIELTPKIIEGIKTLWGAVQPVLSGIINLIMQIIPVVINIVTVVVQVVTKIIQVLQPVFELVIKIVAWLLTNIGGALVKCFEVACSGISIAINAISSVFNGMFGIVKTVVNGVIGLINKMIGAINKINFTIPEEVPVVGGTHIGFNIPTIPQLYKGTNYWQGGIVQIHERGGEIVDLPRGSRVYPHDKSVQKAYADGKKSSTGNGIVINIPKLAEQIIVREDADIDSIADKLSKKLVDTARNMGGMKVGYLV